MVPGIPLKFITLTLEGARKPLRGGAVVQAVNIILSSQLSRPPDQHPASSLSIHTLEDWHTEEELEEQCKLRHDPNVCEGTESVGELASLPTGRYLLSIHQVFSQV